LIADQRCQERDQQQQHRDQQPHASIPHTTDQQLAGPGGDAGRIEALADHEPLRRLLEARPAFLVLYGVGAVLLVPVFWQF
jgi:hypothetical protein